MARRGTLRPDPTVLTGGGSPWVDVLLIGPLAAMGLIVGIGALR